MTWIEDAHAMQPLKHLRIAATTVAATTAGLFRIAARRQAPRVLLAVGDTAPEFALPGTDGRPHHLAEICATGDAVVVAWFPKAFTGGCTTECESLGRSAEDVRRYRVQFFGANVDSVETNRRFAASLGIDYPLLSDPDGRVARAYGVLGASGFPSRWTFFIGADRRILAIDRHVQVSSHGSDVAATLDRLGISRRT
jgi:peroxiredoxin Q/BCP